MAVAYSQYRFSFTKNAINDGRFWTINEVYLYANSLATGANLLTGGTASDNGHYNSQLPSYAIDGSTSTYWESSNRVDAGNTPALLTIVLPAAVAANSLRVRSTTYSNERPIDWKLLGSNDGSTWVELAAYTGWPNSDENVAALNLVVSGVSKLSNGVRSNRVLVHNWATGALLTSIVPNTDGSWSYRPMTADDLMITHIGPSGYKPEVDGPVTPYQVP